ncbi:hypothetical protein FD754_013156 [Muntiacus muntjak]|uniref:Methyltransferase like 15 n=1 Tax=Muntiacus muntjak TaxID=9888 RepID=A0A5N3VGA4_MUNMU|nr:hypothetical protein FD754_013156 [Muntiacus muntjak]
MFKHRLSDRDVSHKFVPFNNLHSVPVSSLTTCGNHKSALLVFYQHSSPSPSLSPSLSLSLKISHINEIIHKQIRAILGQFSQAEALLMKAGVQPGTLDGVLLDLGCSSMQLDTPERGFSLRKDGPLDMRMDGDRYPDMPTAADVVNALDQQALASILRTYGEEKHAKKIASAIVQARGLYPITRTQQLASIVAESKSKILWVMWT